MECTIALLNHVKKTFSHKYTRNRLSKYANEITETKNDVYDQYVEEQTNICDKVL